MQSKLLLQIREPHHQLVLENIWEPHRRWFDPWILGKWSHSHWKRLVHISCGFCCRWGLKLDEVNLDVLSTVATTIFRYQHSMTSSHPCISFTAEQSQLPNRFQQISTDVHRFPQNSTESNKIQQISSDLIKFQQMFNRFQSFNTWFFSARSIRAMKVWSTLVGLALLITSSGLASVSMLGLVEQGVVYHARCPKKSGMKYLRYLGIMLLIMFFRKDMASILGFLGLDVMTLK